VSIAVEQGLPELRQQMQAVVHRLDALERFQRRAQDAMDALQRHNAAKKAKAAGLHAAIRAALDVSPQSRRVTAKHVLRALDLEALGYPTLSLRAIRAHMALIRGSTRVVPPQ